MFVNDRALPHLLAPETYSSARWLESELKHVFSDWTIVAISEDLAADGAYLSTELTGIPILLWRKEGKLQAFRNICLHRHAVLMPKGAGKMEKLQCNYHGWTYSPDGRLKRMPEGASFKGACLKTTELAKVRIEALGPFIFATPKDESPDLRTYLGKEAYDFLTYFYEGARLLRRSEMTAPVNWKTIAENAIESYHTPIVHKATFGGNHDEVYNQHLLEPRFSAYVDSKPFTNRGNDLILKLLSRLFLSKGKLGRFRQTHLYPNALFYSSEMIGDVRILTPITPESTRIAHYTFSTRHARHNFLRPLYRLFCTILANALKKVYKEDESVWSLHHQGLKHSLFEGCIGTREERVHHFQTHISARIQEASSEPHA